MILHTSVGWMGRRNFKRFENLYHLGGFLILFISFTGGKKKAYNTCTSAPTLLLNWSIHCSGKKPFYMRFDCAEADYISQVTALKERKHQWEVALVVLRIDCLHVRPDYLHLFPNTALPRGNVRIYRSPACLYIVINGKLWCQLSIPFNSSTSCSSAALLRVENKGAAGELRLVVPSDNRWRKIKRRFSKTHWWDQCEFPAGRPTGSTLNSAVAGCPSCWRNIINRQRGPTDPSAQAQRHALRECIHSTWMCVCVSLYV